MPLTAAAGLIYWYKLIPKLHPSLPASLQLHWSLQAIMGPALLTSAAAHQCSLPLWCCTAALGPNHAAITALEGKLEAVRTAMTASVRLMMQDLAAEFAAAGVLKASPGFSQAELGAGVVAAQLTASEAVNAAVTSHQEALNVSQG